MRTFDIELVNGIANHPSVLPLTGYNGEFDFSDFMDDWRHFFLEHDGVVMVFLWGAPGVYEAHVMAREECRGARSIAIGRSMIEYMRNQGADMVWGQPSISNRAAIWYIRRIGANFIGDGYNPLLGPVSYYAVKDMQCRQH